MRPDKPLSAALISTLAVTTLTLNVPTTNNNNNNNLALTSSPHDLTTTPPLTDDDDPHVQCIRITDPPQPGLYPTHCPQAIGNACAILTHPTLPNPNPPPRDQWVWSSPLRGCSLGWFLPTAAPGPPPRRRCVAVFEAIIDACATRSEFNAGAVNVGVLPRVGGGDGTGRVPGAARYVMAPGRLTGEAVF